MLGMLALLACFALVTWLFVRDQRVRPMPSPESWLPFAWFVIVGTRPLSAWFSVQEEDSADAFLEGSPLDRYSLMALILIACVVLLRKRPQWFGVLRSNFWFMAFIAYCAVSVVWSDYPFVSFKRWVRELGNVVMVLVILTQDDAGKTTRALLARFAYLVIPLSAVLILYFPALGTYYSDLEGISYCGVATYKNMLGSIMFISGVYLAWELLYVPDGKDTKVSDLAPLAALWGMAVWLLVISSSSTALICLAMGSAVLLLMKLTLAQRQVRHLGTYTLLGALLLLGLFSLQGTLEIMTGAVGRDLTFTGRTELWGDVLREPINPLLGTGYQSFWLGARADDLWERYLFHPRQSHNGYLETYLNGGLLGLLLLLALIASIGKRLKTGLLAGNRFTVLLFSFWVASLFYNFTESRFVGPNLIWILLSVAALYHPAEADLQQAG
ncbi:exopolysaccharide biosynthesis protein [Citrifermentans bemidjiense Bem]|uniref:Exopolysaccharide biosynthesis protein n=2 Tax=Citrifermentans bemidjiense TaxID=225194 RepID=B5EGZ5_CITBB|nr:exopolysaccharide biosynthesis protein [Citrifermentans bemidjiense Bem]